MFLLSVFALFFILTICGSVSADNNTTERVSISTNGSASNGYSFEPSISADGRYVAFSSYADNLVTGDNNWFSDIFVRGRLLNITERVSVSSTGGEINLESGEPSISANGRYVAFVSGIIRPKSCQFQCIYYWR